MLEGFYRQLVTNLAANQIVNTPVVVKPQKLSGSDGPFEAA